MMNYVLVEINVQFSSFRIILTYLFHFNPTHSFVRIQFIKKFRMHFYVNWYVICCWKMKLYLYQTSAYIADLVFMMNV
jgi:hypothetical protein